MTAELDTSAALSTFFGEAEPDLTVLADGLATDDDIRVDALAADPGGRPVAVLVASEERDDLLLRILDVRTWIGEAAGDFATESNRLDPTLPARIVLLVGRNPERLRRRIGQLAGVDLVVYQAVRQGGEGALLLRRLQLDSTGEAGMGAWDRFSGSVRTADARAICERAAELFGKLDLDVTAGGGESRLHVDWRGRGLAVLSATRSGVRLDIPGQETDDVEADCADVVAFEKHFDRVLRRYLELNRALDGGPDLPRPGEDIVSGAEMEALSG